MTSIPSQLIGYQQFKDRVMIRHTKYRCQININPPVVKRLAPGEAMSRQFAQQSPLKSSFMEGRLLKTQHSITQSSEFISDKVPYTPYDYKAKTSFKDFLTSDCTPSQSYQSGFYSRHDIFESPPQSQRKSHMPFSNVPKTDRQNRLIGLTRVHSKSIIMNQTVDEFSFDMKQFQQKRGSSEQLNRLRKQNQQLKRLLNDDWQCNCQSPYINQQVQYLRKQMLNHYQSKCSKHNRMGQRCRNIKLI